MLPHVLFNFRTNNRAAFPVTTGLQMHYDADAGNTFTRVGAAISQWRDRSGFSRHAAQATSNQQPSYLLNCSITQVIQKQTKLRCSSRH